MADKPDIIASGATLQTERNEREMLAAGDRIMQHYLGEGAPEYGDARFMFDYALMLTNQLRQKHDDYLRALPSAEGL